MFKRTLIVILCFNCKLSQADIYKESPKKQDFSWSATVEGSININGHNALGQKVNVLQYLQPDQSALNALRGFDASTQIGALAAQLSNANDDGVRGHLVPTGKLNLNRVNLIFKYNLPNHFYLNLFVPAISMKLSNVAWVDQTKSVSLADNLTKAKLTDNFVNNIEALSGGLKVGTGWDRIGFGDAEITLRWLRTFHQTKPILKSVQLGLYGGLGLPTGKRSNEDQLFSIPFGRNGATAVLLGGNIQLRWWEHLRGGINLNLIQPFETTYERRIKTDPNQTDLIFLAKAPTQVKLGLTQQFTLYLEGYHLFKNCSVQVGYNYAKHNQDSLKIISDKYSSEIANTAISLQELTQHSAIFTASFTGKLLVDLYYKHPFNGKATIQSQIFGCSIGYNL